MDEAAVARCVAEANVFALAAHQYWGTWALLQVRGRGAGLGGWSGVASCTTRGGGGGGVLHSRQTTRPAPPRWLQAKWSSIDFDYLAYSQLRWGEYRRRKDEFLAQALAAFASPS